MNPSHRRSFAGDIASIVWSVGVPVALLLHATASAQVDSSTCGPIAHAFGPYDYRTDRSNLAIVEGPHFPPLVEALIGTKRASVGGDLDYTLRAFPNHHRALIAVMRYGEKLKSPHPGDLSFPVECYFDRALRFRSDDTIVRMIYAQFLARNGRPSHALQQLAMADSKAGDNAFTHYNIGMVYMDLKEYDKAMAQARKAYDLGFNRPELRERLAAVGKWTEPPIARPTTGSDSGNGEDTK